jgi:hypothetical protein
VKTHRGRSQSNQRQDEASSSFSIYSEREMHFAMMKISLLLFLFHVNDINLISEMLSFEARSLSILENEISVKEKEITQVGSSGLTLSNSQDLKDSDEKNNWVSRATQFSLSL